MQEVRLYRQDSQHHYIDNTNFNDIEVSIFQAWHDRITASIGFRWPLTMTITSKIAQV